MDICRSELISELIFQASWYCVLFHDLKIIITSVHSCLSIHIGKRLFCVFLGIQ